MLFGGLQNIGSAIGDVIRAPFKLAGGIAQTALGVVTLPFQAVGALAGGLFGSASPAAMHGAQAGILPFI